MPENVNTSALALSETEAFDSYDGRQTMIKVDHVSMVFNMASEQLNSLKEYAIQIARRKLFFQGFTALDDISFEVKKGDVFGIIGTNGSGKSTLLKIIAGVLDPTMGTCEINGNIAPLIELGAGFDSELSARENIYLNGALLGYSKAFIDEHFDEIVDFAEIETFLDMPLKNYSSGMVARIAFAIATVIVPEILVVDEVLSVGDFMFQKKCEDRINDLIDEHGVTVLIVSHSNDQIERLCNKAIWIEKGHVRMAGSASSACRIYGGIGGRTGSAEAEKRVFEALIAAPPLEKGEEITAIAGDDPCSTAVRLASYGWSKGFDTAVVVSLASHINAVMAEGLAGATNAPILPTTLDRIPDTILSILRESKPKTIYYIDCGRTAPIPLGELKKLPWSPELIEFTNEGDVLSLSEEIERYGTAHRLWGDILMLTGFNDNPESLAAAPIAYREKCPVITLREELPLDAFSSIVQHGSYKTALIIGGSANSAIDAHLEQLGLKVERIAEATTQKTCIKIAQHALASRKPTAKGGELCAASLSLSQWTELLGAGPYAARKNGALLLENTNDLDDISACLDFLRDEASSLTDIVFIGRENGLSHLDRELLFRLFESNQPGSL